jgi:hypothetical protein
MCSLLVQQIVVQVSDSPSGGRQLPHKVGRLGDAALVRLAMAGNEEVRVNAPLPGQFERGADVEPDVCNISG